ncbi:MAG: LysR family transcriptional regulator [Burkholderiaceae bacterium]|jgi:DNA-binding transcriptional LysR family regulator|nr:LysR family transcriptional regulator [Burkholderiaceae bacterium]
MDLRDMRHFLAVAQEGHIGRAAARLHLSQPPLTRHIQALEKKLGVPLFVRTPKGVTLTEAGRTLLEDAPNLLALAEQAAQRTRQAGQGLIGQLDVGLFGSGILDVIPRILARFHQARPEIKIVLHNLTKDAQLQALRERRIDAGFNRLVPEEAGIRVDAVLREAMVVAIPAAHPLAARPVIRLRDLEEVPLITYPNLPMRGLAQEVADAFRFEGVQQKVEQDVEDVVTAMALVSTGFGAAITTQSATNLRLPGVVFRPLRSARLKKLELSCLYRSGDTSPVLKAFLDVVHEFARDARACTNPAPLIQS